MAIITLLEMGMITSMMTIMVTVPVITMSCVVFELSSAQNASLTK